MISPKNRYPRSRSHLATYAMITASIIVILAGIQAAKSVLAPIFMATFLSVILVPPLRFLRSKGFSQISSLSIVILSVLVIGISTTTIITTQLNQFSHNLPDYSRRFNDILMNYNVDLSDIFPFFEKEKEETPPAPDPDSTLSNQRRQDSAPQQTVSASHVRSVALVQEKKMETPSDTTPPLNGAENDSPVEVTPLPSQDDLTSDNNPIAVTDEEIPPPETWVDAPEKAVKVSSQQLFIFLRGFIGELTLFASNAFIVMLLMIFMLLEATHLPEKVAFSLEKRQNLTSERLNKVTNDIRRYMTIKTFVSIMVGCLVTIMLTVMRVQYPALWGVIAFFLNFIPNIGSVVAAIPPIILATVDLGVVSGLIVAVFMVIINCVIGYILEPKLLGDGLDLSPLVVLLSLIFCGWLLGPVGMFLSPPLAVIAKIILQSFPETRWIATLMANHVPVTSYNDE